MDKKSEKKISLLFICTGNTCRSPMAEQIFVDFLTKKGLNLLFKVSSAGIYANKTDTINPNAYNALIQLGIKPKKQRAKQITRQKTSKTDVIICMTQGHKDWLANTYGQSQNVFTFSIITGACDVPDPYGQSEEKYLSCAKYLSYACEDILNLINKTVR